MDKHKENDKHICRAKITPSESGSDYDFEAVAVPAENGQIRYSWTDEEYFMQILRTKPENIDTSRMDSGLPLFDNHPEAEDAGAMNQLGITVGYSFDERGIVVRCKFGARADEALRADVTNGIIKTVSIEGTIQNYSISRMHGELPKYYAELWTPESLSFAPVPNDIGAQIEVKRKIADQIKRGEPKPETKTGLASLKSKFKKD